MRAIPLARSARSRHELEPIVGRDGTLDAADAGAARRSISETMAPSASGRRRWTLRSATTVPAPCRLET
jgi:hypothetical protein